MEIHELVTDSRSLLNTHYTNGDAFQCIRERWSLTRSANCNRVFKTSVRTLYSRTLSLVQLPYCVQDWLSRCVMRTGEFTEVMLQVQKHVLYAMAQHGNEGRPL